MDEHQFDVRPGAGMENLVALTDAIHKATFERLGAIADLDRSGA